MALGGLLGLAGSILSRDVRIGLASLLAVAAIVIGVLDMSTSNLKLMQCDRETPHRWLYVGPLRWATWNGAALGLGFTSRIGFWLWYVVPVSVVLSGDPALGALIYGSYGLVRGWSVWLHLLGSKREASPEDPVLRLMQLYPRVRLWTATVLTMAGIVSSIVLGL